MRVVVDTGVFVSALICRRGTTGKVLQALRDNRFTVIYSTDMLVEIVNVLGREKFHKKYHIQPDDIAALIDLMRLRGELVIPIKSVSACRDPKDDKFLEAALIGEADLIVSGDADLLDMVSFEQIPIIQSAEFLDRLQ
jgi:putative PIN family toxin of toxin-antitoxin system